MDTNLEERRDALETLDRAIVAMDDLRIRVQMSVPMDITGSVGSLLKMIRVRSPHFSDATPGPLVTRTTWPTELATSNLDSPVSPYVKLFLRTRENRVGP